MNFFEHQDNARRNTGLLIFLYVLAMIAITVLIFVPVAVVVAYSQTVDIDYSHLDASGSRGLGFGLLLDEVVAFFAVFLVVSAIIGGGTFWMTSQLSAGGGERVADMLGARRVSPSTTDLKERRLLNVVEEMAIAAGLNVPTVFVMDNENSINAFAAGYKPNEAVVSVTRGTLELLNRDELQGVIGHEFSHILNGDMRMNIRLIGTLYGLELLVYVGWMILRSGTSSRRYSSSNKNAGGAAILMFIGIGVIIAGSVGMFFSSLIKAAISRQREFLADASAVQFTRNPGGIAGALKKIGAPTVGSVVTNENATSVSHMFMASSFKSFFSAMFATHPPLDERIKRIDPTFDGKFPARIVPVSDYDERDTHKDSRSQVTSGFNANVQTTSSPVTSTVDDSSAITNAMNGIGSIDIEQLLSATALLDSLPPQVINMTNNADGAVAAMFAVLIDKDSNIAAKQFDVIRSRESDWGLNASQNIVTLLATQSDAAKFALVQRSFPALRLLGVTNYQRFRQTVELLIAADGKIDLFEYAISALLLRDLDVHFGLERSGVTHYYAASAIRKQICLILSYVAYSGATEIDAARRAYEAGCCQFDKADAIGIAGTMLDAPLCKLNDFDAALRAVAVAKPAIKKKVLEAVIACVIADNKITPREEELVRAMCAMIGLPCIAAEQMRALIHQSF
ncbi:MAG: M48 family metallopeptidase [Planctomycetaceae bacterium]|jgi:Zn-dependent protease with chaperone function|nr:M48 family metallopeptidase [Planctomycetaceae bacterium]